MACHDTVVAHQVMCGRFAAPVSSWGAPQVAPASDERESHTRRPTPTEPPDATPAAAAEAAAAEAEAEAEAAAEAAEAAADAEAAAGCAGSVARIASSVSVASFEQKRSRSSPVLRTCHIREGRATVH